MVISCDEQMFVNSILTKSKLIDNVVFLIIFLDFEFIVYRLVFVCMKFLTTIMDEIRSEVWCDLFGVEM